MFTKYRERGRVYQKVTDWDAIFGVCVVIIIGLVVLANI